MLNLVVSLVLLGVGAALLTAGAEGFAENVTAANSPTNTPPITAVTAATDVAACERWCHRECR